MKTNQAFLFLLWLCSGLFYAQAQNQAQSNEQEPYLTKTFSPNNLFSVDVETYCGHATAIGGEGDPRIEVYIRSNHGHETLSKADIEKRLRNYVLKVGKDATTLRASVRRIGDLDASSKSDWADGLLISFKVYIPTNVHVFLRTFGGNVRIDGLSSNQTASAIGGDIDIVDGKGHSFVHARGGNVAVKNFSGSLIANAYGKDRYARTSRGKLDPQIVNANKYLRLDTLGGNVTVEHFSGTLEAKANGGNLNVGIKELDKSLTLASSAGNVNVRMPMTQGMNLNLSGDQVNMATQDFKGIVREDRVKGKLKGGGIPVRVTASGGSVRVD
jgi:hypothetical protein